MTELTRTQEPTREELLFMIEDYMVVHEMSKQALYELGELLTRATELRVLSVHAHEKALAALQLDPKRLALFRPSSAFGSRAAVRYCEYSHSTS